MQLEEHLDFEAEAKKYLEGKKKESKVIPFWPVFLSKDIFVVFVFLTLFFFLACFNFNFALDPINFDPANNLKTPPHIYPEWYFLWSYEVLRGFFFSSDFGLAMFGLANVIFFALPFLDRSPVVAPAHKRPAFLVWFIVLLVDMIVLTIFGKLPPDIGINKWIGLGASTIFIALFIILPFITKNEKVGGSH